jgi:hypothetical protein
MSAETIETFARQAHALLSRRRTLHGMAFGLASASASRLDDTLARDKKRKKRRRKRKRRKQRNRSSPATCAGQCSAAFEVFLDRAEGSTLCEDTFSTSCKPCLSDQDCVDSGEPYCLRLDGLVDRETNEPRAVLRDLCGPFFDAVCAQIVI